MSTSRPINHVSIDETLLQKICRLAEAGDENALRVLEAELEKENIYFSTFDEEGNNPLILLAKQGKKAAVDLLINKFSGSHNHATQGYAYGGYHQLVEEQLERGASPSYAVQGYAERGDHARVKAMMARGASGTFAIRGYAVGDQYEQVAALIKEQGIPFDDVRNIYLSHCPCDQAITHLRQLRLDFPNYMNDSVKDIAVFYARKGDRERVESRLAFDDSTSAAVVLCNYLRGGNSQQASSIEMQYPAAVAEGYLLASWYSAYQGKLSEVIRLLELGKMGSFNLSFIVNTLVLHFANGGHFMQLSAFLKMYGRQDDNHKYIVSAAIGYAQDCHIEQLNQLMKDIALNRNSGATILSIVEHGLQESGHLNSNNISRLVLSITDLRLRDKIINAFLSQNKYTHTLKAAVSNKIGKLISIKNQYSAVPLALADNANEKQLDKLVSLMNDRNNPLHARQALAYLRSKLCIFLAAVFCEEGQLSNDAAVQPASAHAEDRLVPSRENLIRPRLPSEIIMRIFSYALGCQEHDLAKIEEVALQRCRLNSDRHRFFSSTVKIEEVKEHEQQPEQEQQPAQFECAPHAFIGN